MTTTKKTLLSTAAYYAPPTDQAADAPEAPQSAAQRPAHTPKNEPTPSDARKGQPQRARAPPTDNDGGVSAMSIARFVGATTAASPCFSSCRPTGLVRRRPSSAHGR